LNVYSVVPTERICVFHVILIVNSFSLRTGCRLVTHPKEETKRENCTVIQPSLLTPHPQTQVSKFNRNAVTSQFLVPVAYSKHC